MRNIWTIAKREYKAYFSSFTAYLFAFIVLLVVGILVTESIIYSLNQFGQVPPPDVQVVVGPMMFLLVFACPAFTMRLLAEEQRLGTIELLLTAPVRDVELVIGKWLGSFLLVLTLLAVTLVYPAFLNQIVDPGIDQGIMISGYLGMILVSAVFLSIGVAISSMFNNQVATFIVTFGIIVLFWWIFGILAQVGDGNSLLTFLDLSSHFYDTLMQGVISLAGVVYSISLTAAFLLLGTVSVETRRWR
jgi:ABC-2 type transport system permease protein